MQKKISDQTARRIEIAVFILKMISKSITITAVMFGVFGLGELLCVLFGVG